ncbi:hypothetical protein AVEN_225851-1 [Araneus ventricosus]|uniref:SOCS box domain-containing protein n=1 Tax=Araneus ventricosus TaxID=182803 RepID=A0A4Y2BAF6_ARAVE|nr:hypothetical protein AVEN_225851-1 [Araneus ventricosus]
MMDQISCDKIRFQVVVLTKAQEFAAYNFKFQPSVQYLDLATNEKLVRVIQPSSFKTIFTNEDIRKRISPERQILYRLHLDLPVSLQSFSCRNRTEIVIREGFHFKHISIFSSVYNHDLERYIVRALESERRKIEKLRNYMKIFELLKFGASNRTSIFLCDSILTIMYNENCRDFELLRKFLTLFRVPLWLSRSEIPRVFEYVLLQAQIARYTKDLWRCLDQRIDPVTFCFLCHKIQNMHLLIKYGTITFIPYEFKFDKYIPGNIFNRAVDLGIVSYPRAFRIFQLFFDFLYHQHSPHVLRCMWRSIKDPFLNTTEIESTLKPTIPSIVVEYLCKYYANRIIDEDNAIYRCRSGPTPRTLKDLCRVDIRRFLSNNYQLPFGISGLVIPETLKSYLNLESIPETYSTELSTPGIVSYPRAFRIFQLFSIFCTNSIPRMYCDACGRS